MAMAVLSPCPLLQGTVAGQVIIVSEKLGVVLGQSESIEQRCHLTDNLPSDNLFLLPSPGGLVGAVNRDAHLRKDYAGRDPERPQSKRPSLVRGLGAGGLNGGLDHHVPAD